MLVLDTGESWYLEDFQIEVVIPILKGVKEVWAVIPEGNGKLEPLSSVLPTPTGQTTMGDVKVGDQLLGSDGKPTTVIYVTPVQLGEDCYRVTFSDGASRVVGGNHLWWVEDAQDHYNGSVRSTEYLASKPLKLMKRGKGGRSEVARWRVPTAARRCGPKVHLPVDPYTLGVWLADGDSDSGSITSPDQGVWTRIVAAGYQLGKRQRQRGAYRMTVLGLVSQLRHLGVLGNKHIPADYLLAPESDRWALLQGLVDSDGTVSKAGQVIYSSSRNQLASDVRRLAWSLGLPCSMNEDRAVLNGVDYGPTWDLTISCDQRHPVVSLPRKAARLKVHAKTADHRRIVSIDRVSSVPAKCIQVDGPDGLYLTGEAYIPTHNTTLMAGVALYHCDYTPAPWVPVAASSRDQAEILAQQAYAIIRQSPGLEKRFRIYEGYRKIISLRNGGRGIKVYAADANTGDGVIPTLALCDEGHRWPDLTVYRLWRGKLNKRGGQIAMISTAGEPGGEFEQTRDQIRDMASDRYVEGAHIRSTGKNIVMNEWKVRDEKLIADMEAVKEANPFSGITEETLADEYNSPTTDLGEWKRLKCNLPARTILAAITETEWSAAYSAYEVQEGEHVDVGIDVAWKHDTFAITPMYQYSEDEKLRRLLMDPTILTPPRDGSTMHPDEVKSAIEMICETHPIDTAVIDLERAEDIASWMEDEMSIVVIDRPQGNANAVADYDAFMKALRNGKLQHSGHEGMRRHVMNAIARSMPGDKKRFDRPSQSRAKKRQQLRVIDALTAAAMINQYVDENVDMGEMMVTWA
jgi:phage terminase large subunit-like protein